MRDIGLAKVFAILDVLEPILTERFSFLVRLCDDEHRVSPSETSELLPRPLTLKIPSLAVKRGNRTRSILDWSNTVVVLRMPSVMLLARSKIPTAGLVNAPTNPFPTPLKNPAAPPASAPSSGFVCCRTHPRRHQFCRRETIMMALTASPSTPDAILVTSEVAPAVTPYKACFGLFRNCRMRR